MFPIKSDIRYNFGTRCIANLTKIHIQTGHRKTFSTQISSGSIDYYQPHNYLLLFPNTPPPTFPAHSHTRSAIPYQPLHSNTLQPPLIRLNSSSTSLILLTNLDGELKATKRANSKVDETLDADEDSGDLLEGLGAAGNNDLDERDERPGDRAGSSQNQLELRLDLGKGVCDFSWLVSFVSLMKNSNLKSHLR